LDHQWMAILWQIGQQAWSGWANFVASQAMGFPGLQQLRHGRRYAGQRKWAIWPLPYPYRRQRRDQVLRPSGEGPRQDGVLAHRRLGMRIWRSRNGDWRPGT